MEQYNKMLLFLDMTTFNCYGYAMSYNYMPTNMIPGGIANFAKNVDKSAGKYFNKIFQYDPAFFNSRKIIKMTGEVIHKFFRRVEDRIANTISIHIRKE